MSGASGRAVVGVADEGGAAASSAVDESEIPRVVLELGGGHGDVWLVKVPHGELADAITGAVDGEIIGEVVIKAPVEASAADGGRPRKRKETEVKLVVDETLAKRHAAARASEPASKQNALHNEYTMAKKDVKQGSMLVMAEEPAAQGGVALASAAVDGAVTKHFTLKVESLELLRDRFNQRVEAELPQEHTATVNRPIMSYNPRDPARLAQLKKAAEARREKPAAKTTAYGLSDDDIRARLFKRFEAYSYYSLSDLAKLEKLPQNRVREVLVTIADREEEGEHRNKWSLKSALRT